MHNFFDKSVHFLGKNSENVFIINIGAMDGVMFDELAGYTNVYKFSGLYVEPIPYLFEKLKSNFDSSSNKFENAAVSDYNGTIQMMTIDREAIDTKLVHDCFYGMSAIIPAKNGLGSEFDRPTVEKYGKIVEVPCTKLDDLLRKHDVHRFDVLKVDAEGHDYVIFKQIDFKKYRPKVVRIEWINLNEHEQYLIKQTFEKENYVFEISGQDIVGLPNEFHDEVFNVKKESTLEEKKLPKNFKSNSNRSLTLVTGLWDIGRGDLKEGWSRKYSDYLEFFKNLLSIESNMIIFGDHELEKFVKQYRSEINTQFILRDLSWFKSTDFFEKIQKIRTNPSWYNQVGWLTESTQAKLEMYNPLVMSKMFLLHDAKILDKFDSDLLFWIDGGISKTVHPGYFTHDGVLSKLSDKVDNFMFTCFPYDGKVEIHGFEYKKMCQYSGKEVNMVARGGFFGGTKDAISRLNSIYYSLMLDTLDNGYMGTEESLFTILTYRYPNLIDYAKIEDNGLLFKVFEDLKNDSMVLYTESPTLSVHVSTPMTKIALYVIGFNSPNQFKTLIDSMLEYDPDFIKRPTKYLLDNSTDLSTTPEYQRLCDNFGFEHIKKDNLGICGGRQWIAEHAEENEFDGYWFSEDDMFFQKKQGEVCKNGFPRYVENFYKKCLEIVKKERFDFLKINFTEFFGDNSTQWSWYNVPQEFREKNWPNKSKLPVQGLDPNPPRTLYHNIKSHEGVPYATGEIYYCNWTQFVTREGNKKMFLETKWAHPFENTWMSYMYQETIKGKINPGILLMTPVEHNRFDHYDRGIRKEN